MRTHARSVFSLLVRFLARESGGSLLPMFALTMVPVMGMVGAAVDYSRASGVQTGLQAALDAAVLAGARHGELAQCRARYLQCQPSRPGSFGDSPDIHKKSRRQL